MSVIFLAKVIVVFLNSRVGTEGTKLVSGTVQCESSLLRQFVFKPLGKVFRSVDDSDVQSVLSQHYNGYAEAS